MYNKSEAYPCIKVEKENKNIKVRKKIKSLNLGMYICRYA